MPTILELKQEEWMPYIKAGAHQPPGRMPALDAEATRTALIERARELAKVLKKQFSNCRILVFGSLAHAAWFMPDSDIDLAVEGLPPEAFWTAWKIAEEAFPDHSVDLIDMDLAGKSLREAIARQGIEI